MRYLILILLGFILINCSNTSEINEELNLQDTIIITDSIEFSREQLKKYIKHLNLKHPDIVYAQAVLETGNFSSQLFKNNNNLFGFKEPKVRNNTSRGSANGYAYYLNWKQSVIDYALYQSSYLRKLNKQQYFNYLDKNYAKDPNYSIKLKQIIKNYE